MFTIAKLTGAAIKMFLRNRQALFFTLFMPFLIMLIFGYIGFDKPPKIDVGLVTHNPSAATQEFVSHIKDFPTFTIHEGDLDGEKAKLNEGDRAIILDVPDNFVSTAPATQPQTLTVYTNEGKAGEAETVISILNQYLDKTTLAVVHAPTLFEIHKENVNARNLRYIEFLLPGLIALSIMQMSVFSVAFVFTQYKEQGVLKRLLATPMKPYQFVTANVITRLLVAMVQTSIFVGLGLILFKVHVVGSYGLLALCVFLGALMFLGLGFSVSGLAKTVDSVPAIANLIVFPMLFLGGTFFSVSNMPSWLQVIAKVLPLTYFSGALRDVMTKGSSLWDIRYDMLAMLAWAVVLIAVATITFRFQEKEGA